MTFGRMSKGRSLFTKAVSLFIVQAFLLSNIAFAITEKPATDIVNPQDVVTNPEKIVIPRDFGLIKSKYIGKSDNLIIHIQDAHCNYEAQSNIVRILENLIKNYNVSLVSVEGADGYVDTSWFKAFPDEEVRKEVATYFMKKGEITGPEFLSITTDYPIKLFGAETRSYYIQNLNAFTSSYPLKDDTEKYYNQVKTILNKLKNYIYSEELKAMDARMQDYESKKMPFNDYVRFLESMAEKHRINLREYDNFFKLISALIYEKKIDFNVVDKERSALIDELSKAMSKDALTELVTKSLYFKVGKISSVEYYDYLRSLSAKNGIELSKAFPNLFNYIIYNTVYSRIENEKLFNDIKNLEMAIKERLFKNDDQRTLDKLSRHIEILLGLVNIKLLNNDFDYYKAHKEEFSYEVFADFIKKKTIQYGLAYNVDSPNDAVTTSIPKLEDFYSIAIKRDKALVDNTLGTMKKEKLKIAVLVTGGFHSDGITKLLEKQGVSYMVVSPTITKDVPSPYIQILTNQRTPFEEILTGAPEVKKGAEVKQGMVATMLISELLVLANKHYKTLQDINSQISPVNERDLLTRVMNFEDDVAQIVPLLAKAEDEFGDIQGVTFESNPDLYFNKIYARLIAMLAIDKLGGLGLSQGSIKTTVIKELTRTNNAFIIPEVETLLKDHAAKHEKKASQPKGFNQRKETPGQQPISHSPLELTPEQAKVFGDEILAPSFREHTYEIRSRHIDGRKIDICIHYGIEGRIREYNRKAVQYNKTAAADKQKPLIPEDLEVHPGRGGDEHGHRLLQLHMSGLKYFFFSDKEISIIARHEVAHIDIANGIQELVKKGIIEKDEKTKVLNMTKFFAINEADFKNALDLLNSTSSSYLKALKANPQLNEEDYVDSLPGCDTRKSGVRDKFKRLEEKRAKSEAALINFENQDLATLLKEELKPRKENEILKKLDTITIIDQQFEIGGNRVKQVFTQIVNDARNEKIRNYARDYLSHRAILDYITKTREIAGSDDAGFDIYIFVSTSKTEAKYWQERFEATKGQILPKNAIILSVYSEGADRWHGKTDNGSASLYAFTLADELLQDPKYKDRIKQKFEKEKISLFDILKSEHPVMMMLMAGSGKRMQPLGANNKSAIALIDMVEINNEMVPVTVGEAVARTFGPLAATRGGRITEVWGDQINLPGEKENILVASDQNYAIEIFNTICSIQTDRGRTIAVQKGNLLSTGQYRDALLREKPPIEEIEKQARIVSGINVADLSLGFNSYRWELLEALLKMYKTELKDKRGHFNIDSELWAPLTFDTPEAYADFMWGKYLVDFEKKLKDGKIDKAKFEEVTSKSEEGQFKQEREAWWARIHNMLDDFISKNGSKYRVTNGKQGVIGRVDYGIRDISTDWWDFGQIRDYYDSHKLALTDDYSDIDKRRDSWAAERLRRYFGIRNKDEWLKRSSTGETKIENSIVLGCNIMRGNIKNSILVNVTAEEINAENAIIIGSTVYKLNAVEGQNIVQNVISSETLTLEKGDVLVSHYIPNQGQKVFKVNWLIDNKNNPNYYDPDEIYSRIIFNNEMSFATLSKILKEYTKDEQESERAKVLKEVQKEINKKTSEEVASAIQKAIVARDHNAIKAYIEGNYAEQLARRGILTPGLITQITEEFNKSNPQSRARTEMVFLCNLLMKNENAAIRKIAEKGKENLLRDRFGIGATIEPDAYKRDSIRAVDRELSSPLMEAAGAAYVMTLAKLNNKQPSEITIGIGRESRPNGERIENAFIKGILAAGANAVETTMGGKELTSTPIMYFASRYLENGNLSGIIEITASHLKYEPATNEDYNGLKPTNGVINFTTNEMERWREETHDIIDKGIPQGAGVLRQESILEPYWILCAAALRGSIEGFPEWEKLIDKVWAKQMTLKEAIDKIRPSVKTWLSTKPLRGKIFAADSGFGSMGPILGPFLANAGAELIDIGVEADYSKAVHDANPNNPDNLKDLVKKVSEISAMLGMGFDVDADRLGIVTLGKKILRGDDISCIIAPIVIRNAIIKVEREGKEGYKPIIVLNVLCSDRLKQAITEAGGIAIESAVGFNKVKEAMMNPYQFYLEQYPEKRRNPEITPEQTAEMGVEISSHIMFKENFNSDDAFFAVVKLLGILIRESREYEKRQQEVPQDLFDKLLESLSVDYHTGEWRTPMMDNQARIEVANKIREHYEKMAQERPDNYRIRNRLDGLKVDFLLNGKSMGWLAVRPSGTSAEIVVAINSLVSKDIFNMIKNDYFAQMKEYKNYIKWEKLEPEQYKEESKAFVFEGKVLPVGEPRVAGTGRTPGTGAIRTGGVSGVSFDIEAFTNNVIETAPALPENIEINKEAQGALLEYIAARYLTFIGKAQLSETDKALLRNLYEIVLDKVKKTRLESRIAIQQEVAKELGAIPGAGVVKVNPETGALEFENQDLQSAYKDRGWHDFGYVAGRLFTFLVKQPAQWMYKISYSMTHFGELHVATAFGTLPLVPNTPIYASTGSHSQGLTLDVKLMKAPGIQLITVFDKNGKLVTRKAMYLKPGDLAFSIPGSIDIFTIQQGGNQFVDRSIPISEKAGGRIAEILDIDIETLKNSKFAEGLAAKGMPYIFYRDEKGKTRVTANPEYPDVPAPQWVRPFVPEARVDLGVVFNPTKIEEYGRSDSRKILESEEFAMNVVEHIVGKAAEVDTNVPETLRELTPVAEFNATLKKAQEAYTALERAVLEHRPITQTPVFMTGQEGYKWGQPVVTNFILELMGAKTREEKIALAASFGIPENEVIGERWIGVGAIDMGTGYPLPPEVLSLWPKEVFGAERVRESGPVNNITAKALASAQPLSIQIHDFPEMIIPLEDGYAYMGLKKDVTGEEFIAALKKGDVSMFNKVTLRKGAPVIVPAGTPHAYGEVRVFEVKRVTAAQDKTGTISFYDRLKLTPEQAAEVAEIVASNTPVEAAEILIGKGLVREGKDVLTLVKRDREGNITAVDLARIKGIVEKLENYGALNAVNPAKNKFTPIKITPSSEEGVPAGSGEIEIMGVTEGFVAVRYTVNEDKVMKADDLMRNSDVHTLFVTDGKAAVIDEEKGETIAEIEKGEELPIPASVKYNLRAVKGEGQAVVYTQYTPLNGETVVYTAFRAAQNERARVQLEKEEGRREIRPFNIWVPQQLYKGDTMKDEVDYISSITGGQATIKPYNYLNIDEIKANPENDVVVIVDTMLQKAPPALLRSGRILPIPSKYIKDLKSDPRLLGYAREIEAIGFILGNTTKEEIADPMASRTQDLVRIMRQMTGRSITVQDLSALVSAKDATPESIQARLKKLIEQLLLTMPIERYEIDKGLEGRRQVLWSV